ncbi:MAG TPA: aspartate--tRNA ligase [Rhodospirillaceae bacterium]|nr:MAG: aspartate--tRNA ligase [Alphaproteobacteria bacterium GWF2_58_20]HAU28809.1 aspartate--tRNA ligase [Rhodospirillaceae bacterium]
MHAYRTHTCGQLRRENVGETVRLSGWIHRKRNLGQLLFVDLRDHYGITQCVTDSSSPILAQLDNIRVESVITITGKVVEREGNTKNSDMATGEIELWMDEVVVQSSAEMVPLQVNSSEDSGEEIRLTYRYLDLRREKMQKNIKLRSDVIASLRRRMIGQGFTEFQTPILTASSPEGARDFLVPSRIHPGKFYALPQAPQQFKQLLMMAGFDRYFQIAPCFRDEDSRADRSPGEFYQLDFEMSYVTQEDVFSAIEPVLQGIFEEFANWNGKKREVAKGPFPRIPFVESMLKYGCDKPDLRNPLTLFDAAELAGLEDFSFGNFKSMVEKGDVLRAVRVPNGKSKPRSYFDKLGEWAGEAKVSLAYVSMEEGAPKGGIAKFFGPQAFERLVVLSAMVEGDTVLFVAGPSSIAVKAAGQLRTKLGEDYGLIRKDLFAFCWVVDFPMFEFNEETGKIDFSHNPFSMPQGGLEALNTRNPLEINAFQYDIVCNGVELSSGAIRNHMPEIMIRAFEIAGYGQEVLEQKFGGMLAAMRYGAPPHGGSAPGVDRIVMLLADEPNIREVICFPMNQKAEDMMMKAPSEVRPEQLKELHIRIELPPVRKS